ncbi:MAG: protein-L-isoaspartate O-methyltransferase [Hyphomicrobium sp.]
MSNSALQRKNMVESQVRPSDVTDRRITTAMQDVAREKFVPPALASLAYMDDPLAVAPGRSLMAPRTFARLLQLADVQQTDKVLIVGALSGYSAVVMAAMARDIVALDADAGFAAAAKTALSERSVTNVTLATGALESGWAANAPYDVIFVEGGLERVPDALTAQLAATGRMVGIENSGGVGRAVVLQKTGATGAETLSRRVAFEASAACLPGFERAKAFAF